MVKKFVVFILSSLIFLTLLPPVKRQEVSTYNALCSGYWVGMVKSSSSVTLVKCVDSFDEGVKLMKNQTSTSSSVASVFKGATIVSSMYATLDFTTVGSSSVNSYMYAEFSNGTYNSGTDYFNGHYSSEGPYIVTGSTETKAVTIISGLRSRVNKTRSSYTQYNITPISVAAPLNYYVAESNGDMRHYFGYFDSQSSLVIGVAPSFMTKGTKYYSFDGHYFYTSYITMIDDLNSKVYTHAVNASAPWYNYYQFLPFHSTTNYTASELDGYFTSRGYTLPAYAYYSSATNGQSKYPLSTQSMLYGTGSYFMQMQQIYGINPLLLLTISINETAWGRSSIAIDKNNLFGMAAYDSSTSSATRYDSALDSILDVAKVLTSSYFNAASTTNYYHGSILGNKEAGANVKYASDAYWGEKAAAHYYSIDKSLGLKDYNYYTIGISNKETVSIYESASTSKFLYNLNGISRKLKNNSVLILGEQGDYYKIMSDRPLSAANSWTSDGFTAKYNFENNFVFVKKSDITIINKGSTYKAPANSSDINRLRIEYLSDFIPLKINSGATVYMDAYTQKEIGATLKADTYVTATERAYTSSGDYTYKVAYNLANGKTGWIKASDVTEISASYAIKNNKTHDAIGAPVYASTNTNSKVGEVKYNLLPITIIESKVVSSKTWYYVCINASTGTFGWTLSTEYKAAVKHDAGESGPGETTPNSKSGMYYLDQLKLSSDGKSVTLRGLLAIEGIDNKTTTPLTFSLILTNQQTGDEIIIPLERWTDKSEHPYDVNTIPNVKKDYSGAWFKGTIDFTGIPNGDYSARIENRMDTNYATIALTNNNSIPIAQRFTNSSNTSIEFRTNFLLRALPIDIIIRSEGLLSSQLKPSIDNAFIEYFTVAFDKNLLKIKGTAFNVGAEYKASSTVNRTIVLENVETFERFTYDVGSISNGDFKIVLRVDDKMDKTRAWFDASLDISALPKGTYAIYVVTTSGNGIKDYGELADPFSRKLTTTSTVGDRTYSLSLNSSKRNRLELLIK